jgi:hypothetical protein
MPILLLALALLPPLSASAAPVSSEAPTASASPADFHSLGLPASLTKDKLKGLLQRFIDAGYQRSFLHLGEERDFDHGHLLFSAATREPIAILYHTQETAAASAGSARLDPRGRNWLQWLSDGRVENAARYVRASYPRSAEWDWFVAKMLPELLRRHTILDKMLDPTRIGADPARTVQWEFTRVDCGPAAREDASSVIGVTLPDRTPVCLALSAS